MPHDRKPIVNDIRDDRLIFRADLVAAGWHDRAIGARLRGQWVRVRPGAYAERTVWAGLDAAARHHLRACAVLRQAGTGMVLSHASALPSWGAPTWGVDLTDVHVTRRDGRTGRREAGVSQHRGRLEEEDVVERDGVPVTSATRLALDLTTVADLEACLIVWNHLLHSGHTSPDLLATRYRAMEHWPRTLITDLVMRLADGRIESVGESRFSHLCYRQGLPRPLPQHEIVDRTGAVLARVDFAWPELKVFVEFDGKIKYDALLRPGETAADAVMREKRREQLICDLTGWRCIRITWEDLVNPARTAALLRRAFAGQPAAA